MCAPTAEDRVITLSNSQCHAQIMISNITETCVMFNKPSYSISSDGHTENDDGPQTKTATVAAVAAVAEAHSGKQVHRGNRGQKRAALGT